MATTKHVEVIAPVKFFHKGKFYTYGQKFDFDGELTPSLRVVKKEVSKPASTEPVKATTHDVDADKEPVKAATSDADVIVKTVDGAEIVGTFDADMPLSPAAIKAQIAKVEATKPKVMEGAAASTPAPAPHIPDFNLVEVSRGWWDIVDEKGNTVNEKKMRKADAEEELEKLLSA